MNETDSVPEIVALTPRSTCGLMSVDVVHVFAPHCRGLPLHLSPILSLFVSHRHPLLFPLYGVWDSDSVGWEPPTTVSFRSGSVFAPSVGCRHAQVWSLFSFLFVVTEGASNASFSPGCGYRSRLLRRWVRPFPARRDDFVSCPGDMLHSRAPK